MKVAPTWPPVGPGTMNGKSAGHRRPRGHVSHASPRKSLNGSRGEAAGREQEDEQRTRLLEEHGRLLSEAQAARDTAERANRLKDEFIAVVSHELRTPLNAILGWARMLRAGMLDAERAATAIETIERNAQAQAQLIEDLLQISRMVTGRVALETQPMSLDGPIEAALDTLHLAIEAKGLRVETSLDPRAGPVMADPVRFQQIVWNLLSNAIKFTPPSGVIAVRLTPEDHHVVLTVSDTGRGIRRDFLPHVFDAFLQADGSSTRRDRGLGVGLAIVRGLVELHGGTVQAESAGEGLGAVFRVTVPAASGIEGGSSEPAPRKPAVQLESTPDLAGVRVLIVDDDPDARQMLRAALEQRQASVTSAGSAAEALSLLEHTHPDVLVSDVAMPDVDGFTLIRQIRRLPPERGGRVPAAAVTAFGRTEDRTQLLAAGYQTHVPKPIEPAELIAAVRTLAALVGKI